jgi:hypothetical protein
VRCTHEFTGNVTYLMFMGKASTREVAGIDRMPSVAHQRHAGDTGDLVENHNDEEGVRVRIFHGVIGYVNVNAPYNAQTRISPEVT